MTGIDSTAMHYLAEGVADLRSLGIEPYFAGVSGPVMDRLRRAGMDDRIGVGRFFLEVWQAVEAALGTGEEGPVRKARAS